MRPVLGSLLLTLVACGGGGGGPSIVPPAAPSLDDRFACQADVHGPGQVDGEHLGWSQSVGDWTGDGVPDLAVSGSHKNPTQVRVYSGSNLDLDPDAVCLRIQDVACGPARGAALAFTPDLDGDGRDELWVGIPFRDEDPVTKPQVGAVFLFLGGSTGCPGNDAPVDPDAADLVIAGDRAFGRFGYSLAVLDLDGDGDPDLAAGSPGESLEDATWPGAVYFFLDPLEKAEPGLPGEPARLTLADADGVIMGDGPADRFGWALAPLGDLDGVPGDELLATAIQATHLGDNMWDYHGQATGYAKVLGFGAGALLYLGPTPPGPGALVRLYGYACAPLGDLDGDGVTDLLVAAPHYGQGSTMRRGAIYVHSGLTGAVIDGPVSPPELGAESIFGFSVAPAGDVDGDGKPDWVAGAPGHIHLPAKPPAVPPGCEDYDLVGTAIGLALVVSGGDESVLARYRGADGSDQENGKPRFGWSVAVADLPLDGGGPVPTLVVGSIAHTPNGAVDPVSGDKVVELGGVWAFALPAVTP